MVLLGEMAACKLRRMSQPPNILLVFTDQQRADTIGALGNPVIRTPSLDRLVAEGTAFTSAYTPAPECVPARACLMFGQYPGRLRCCGNGDPMPWDEKENIMAALARSGYYAHGIGKCHFTPEDRMYALNGFHGRECEEEITGQPARDDYHQFLMANGFGHLMETHGVRGEMYYIPQPAQMPAALHPTQWVGNRSVAFLESKKRQKQPWFLFSSFIHPHPPFCPPAPWHKLYRDMDAPMPHLPPGCEDLLIHVNRLQNRYKRRDRGYDLQLVRTMRAYYYGCISFIDFQVGRMLAALESTGQLDNTLILFTSDHGELLGDFYSFGKRSYHDACSRIPLLARYPRWFKAGGRSDTPVSLVDVTAAMLAAVGTQLQTHKSDGEDLATLARRRADRSVFSQLSRADYGIYTAVNRHWKYVYSAPDQRELLFDRVADPGEAKDLAYVAQPVAAQMRREVLAWLKGCGQTDAVDGDGWRVYPKREMPADPDAGLIYQDHPWANQHIPGYSR